MEKLVKKYAMKLVEQGLAEPGAPLVGGLDAEVVWNRDDPLCSLLEEVFDRLNIQSLIFTRPAEPYFSILNHLSERTDDAIHPEDCETRTFLHDIPVARKLTAGRIIEALKKRKSLYVRGEGIVTFGTVSPEQAFVTCSSVCFAGFVKFFLDYCNGRRDPRAEAVFQRAFAAYRDFVTTLPEGKPLHKGPYHNPQEVIDAMIEAGKRTINSRMVDSYFGNISYRLNGTIYISRTASSLDELAGCIDACPMDGSSCAGITASSEYTAHKEILENTDNRAILHGHPKFSVILSMICDKKDCNRKDRCHIACPEKRFVRNIPIVPGEVGTGPTGLCRTLPPAIRGNRGALVYGHGIFTVGREDFREAFANLLQIERMCMEEYEKHLG
ncbi:MAG: rRNA adenine dimethylase [Deltaproteobacteria bacterium]|nr:rRNA adenine dimethylase [Deltaproteobacteria bacterium]